MPVARLGGGRRRWGQPFLISAGIVYEIIAAACSSPQTTEINADTRADTLFKWVHIGMVQAAGFVAVAAIVDEEDRIPIILGGGTAMVLMYGQYWHARAAGLASNAPGTEGQPPPSPAAAATGRPNWGWRMAA